MDNDKKNSNLGDEILGIVQSAINSNDFTKLNSEIRVTVDTALKEVREWLRYKEPANPVQPKPTEQADVKETVAQQQTAVQQQTGRTVPQGNTVKQPESGNVHVSFMSSGTVQYKPPVKTETAAGGYKPQTGKAAQPEQPAKAEEGRKAVNYTAQSAMPVKSQNGLVPVPHRPIGKVSGPVLSVVGATMTGAAAGTLALGIIALGAGGAFSPLMTVLLAPAGIFMWVRGKKLTSQSNRFQVYLAILKKRGFANISDLARAVGKSDSYVIRDLQNMVKEGMFVEGHFDDKFTCFIANNASYNQYRTTQDNFYKTEPETVIDESKIKNDKVKAVIKEGNDYIAKIRRINDELPDEEISKKLDTLEMAITKIYFQVEQHPEQLPELDKFLKYYMPTTMKLLDVYCDFDKQPIQGENITTAKKEILGSLDTINQAFVKLFDSLFQATAWDVSTDITVLQTLLANEGLTDTMNMQKGEV